MNIAQPLFDSETHYRIELQGHVDVEWLQSFEEAVEIVVDETGQMDDISVLDLYADQAGIVGLVRRLHGLGMTILQIQVVVEGGASEFEE
jgi:hypothetical protein